MAISLDSAGLRSDARRNQRTILEAAARLLSDDAGASMQAIADAAGVSRPTVYRRFPTRDALIEAIREAIVEDALAVIWEAADGAAPGAEDLAGLIRGLAAVAMRYPVMMELGRMRKEDGSAPKESPQVREAFERLLLRGQRDGSVRSDVTAATLRRVVFGALVLSLKFAALDGADVREVGDEVAKILLDGVRSPDASPPR